MFHIKDYLSFKKKKVSSLKFCCSTIYVITIENLSNKPIQNLLNFPQQTSMDFCKVVQSTVILVKFLQKDTDKFKKYQTNKSMKKVHLQGNKESMKQMETK